MAVLEFDLKNHAHGMQPLLASGAPDSKKVLIFR